MAVLEVKELTKKYGEGESDVYKRQIKNLILFFKIHTLTNIYVYIMLNIDNDQCEVSI